MGGGAGGREDFMDEGAFPLDLRVRRVFQAAEGCGNSMQTAWRCGLGVKCQRGSRR